MSQERITTTLEVFDWAIGYYHFPIDKETTEKCTSDKHKRVVCQINNQIKMHCALMPLGEGSFIMVSKKVRKALAINAGDQVSLELEKDESEYGLPMPESLEMILTQDDQAFEYFKSLTPGKQRSLIYIVSQLKSIDKQITKSMAIADHLKEIQGRLDYKLLNEKIKEYNQNSLLNKF